MSGCTAGSSEGAVRTWANAEGLFDRLVALMPDRLVVANPSTEQLASVVEMVHAGQSPESLLGKTATVIPIAAIRAISANKAISQFDVRYDSGGTRFKNVDMETAAEREEFLREFAARFPSFSMTERTHGAISSMGRPLVLLAIVAGITAFGYVVAATQHHPHSRRLLLISWISELLGTAGVLVIGGIFGVVLLIWLAYRIAHPPTIIKLTPTTS